MSHTHVSCGIVLALALAAGVRADVPGWGNQDIGATGGSATQSDDTIVVQADGADIWGYNDSFHYVYKTLSGNGSITARVDSLSGGADGWAKAGVMIRESLDPASKHAMTVITGGESLGRAFQARGSAADGLTYSWQYDGLSRGYPGWVRIVRTGHQLVGYYRSDTGQWQQIAWAQIAMGDPVHIGLCVTSHRPGTLLTATFSNITFQGNVTDVGLSQGPNAIEQPTTEPGRFVRLLGIASESLPQAFLVADDECTMLGDGRQCRVPQLSEKMHSVNPLLLDLSEEAVARIFNEVAPCGEGPNGFTVCASTVAPTPGRYVLIVVQYEGDIPLNHASHSFTYGLPFDADGIASNNYLPLPQYPYDFYTGTDLWYELTYVPGEGYRFKVTDVRLDYAAVSSNARVTIAGSEMAWFVPLGELPAQENDEPRALFRATVHRWLQNWGLDGTFWSADLWPSISASLAPIPATAIPVDGPPACGRAEPLWPLDRATDIETQTPILRWGSGFCAARHEVYFGTDADAVRNADQSSPEYKGPKALGDESYDPGKLALNTSYFWRIDEINSVNPDSPWVGNVWSFTTGDFFIIDDFEDYDAGDNQIWFAWHGGLGAGAPGTPGYLPGNGTGSAVGDRTTASHTEETIVHGGNQSMPIAYDNNKQGYAKYSETELTLTAPRDWTEEGVKELSLWFRGYPAPVGSFVEGPIGTYTMTGSGANIWAVNGVEDDEFHFAYKRLTGPGSIVARVESVDNTNSWAKAGVMIRETLDPDSAYAFACVTPGNGVASQGRRAPGGSSFSANQTGITAPYWVKVERSISGTFTASHSTNGSTWQPVQGAVPQNIPMGSDVCIGLALTSHDAALTCEAVFTDVTISGWVGPQWTNQDIGILSNDAEPLYVSVSNNAGAPAVVVHDNPRAAQIDVWTEWVIPLERFADRGINLTDVDKVAIGLGTKGNMTTPGGSGKMYFDDIRLNRRRDVPLREGALVIDDFMRPFPPFSVHDVNGVFPQVEEIATPDSTVLGGERDMMVILQGTTTPREGMYVESRCLRFRQDPGCTGQLIVIYDGIDGSAKHVQATSGLGGIDITEGGAHDGIELVILKNAIPVEVGVVLFTGKDDYSQMTQTIPSITSPTGVEYRFSDFFHTGSGADLTALQAMLVVVGPGDGATGPVDMEICCIRTTPVSLAPLGPSAEDFETGDFSRFDWALSGDKNWTATSGAHAGAYCAQAGSIENDETSALEVTQRCADGEVAFYYKVSSELGYDCLRFYIDGVEVGQWSGDQDWTGVSFPVVAGTHTFTWEYGKDGSASWGQDSAWIDDIAFP